MKTVLEASLHQPQPIPELRNYFANLAQQRLAKEITGASMGRVERIIHRNNLIGELLQTAEYTQILKEERDLKGNAKLGGVICIDGRFTTIHPFGRTMNVWEEPASFIEVKETQRGLRVKSPQFIEALTAAAKDKRDLLEIVFAHTSMTTDHKCGRMQAGEEHGEFSDLPVGLTTPEAKNLYLLENRQIPAITNTFNALRKQNRLPALKQVAISAMYDTDTMGVILNHGKGEFQEYSTTSITLSLKDDLEYMIGEHYGAFGHMKDSFTDVLQFPSLSRNIVDITRIISSWDKFMVPTQDYIQNNYPDLTKDQKQTLFFTLARTTAAQYITGLAKVPLGGPDHKFAEHEEHYMSVSLDGKPVGRFDIEEQSFGSSPSDPMGAISHIHTKIDLLDGHRTKNAQENPDILFVTKIVDASLWEQYHTPEGDQTIKRARAALGELCEKIYQDSAINKRIVEDGSLLLVPVLVDQETGKVLEVVDCSEYF